MKTVVLGLIVAAAAEILRYSIALRDKGSLTARIARFVTFMTRPISAVLTVNLIYRLSGLRDPMMNVATYPIFALEWWPDCDNASELIRIAFSCEGIALWLPVSAALCAIGATASFAVANIRPATDRHTALGRWRTVMTRCATLVAAPVAIAALAFSAKVSIGSLPNGMFTGEGQESSLLRQWHDPNGTMLYAIPQMQANVKKYWRTFPKIQHRLKIHARSHPPVASTFVRWIGKCSGVDVLDPQSYRDARSRLRYALGQGFFSSLNVILIFAIGLALFDARVGLFAALLYSMAPSVIAYGTYAADMNYALFFHGAILFTWLVAMEDRLKAALLLAAPLGLCFSMLTMMTFSWCIMTTVSAAFIVLASLRKQRSWQDIAWRTATPLVVMVLLSGWFILHYHIDYISIYKNSAEYVNTFYQKDSFWLKAIAFVGGQVEWLFLMGPLACSGFFMFLFKSCRQAHEPCHAFQRLYLLVILGVFLIPVLLGPACLKHEVARCWIWVAAVPFTCSAWHWLDRSSPRICAFVFTCSAVTSISMRLFLWLD